MASDFCRAQKGNTWAGAEKVTSKVETACFSRYYEFKLSPDPNGCPPMQFSRSAIVDVVRLLTVAVPLGIILACEMSWSKEGLFVVALLTMLGTTIAIGITTSGRRAFRTLARLDPVVVQTLPQRSVGLALKLAGVLVFLPVLGLKVTSAAAYGDGPMSGLRGYEEILYSVAGLAGGFPTGAPVILAAFFLFSAAWVDFRRCDATPDWRKALLISGSLGLFSIPVLFWTGGGMYIGGWMWGLAILSSLTGAWMERGILVANSAVDDENLDF